MDSQQPDLGSGVADLGRRWEIVDTGITVKLYPSCAGTHPTLDALLDLRRREGFAAEDVEAVAIGVDPIVPTILLYDTPSSGLEGKFSMPFCAARHGQSRRNVPAVAACGPAIPRGPVAGVDASIRARRWRRGVTQARVTVPPLRDGRALDCLRANGARLPGTSSERADRARFVPCSRTRSRRRRRGADARLKPSRYVFL